MESDEYQNFKGIEGKQAITVDRPAEVLYLFLRMPENFAEAFGRLKSVRVLDDKRSHWVARGPLGWELEWTSELTRDVANRLLEWRSVDGDVKSIGAVEFYPAPGGGTEMKVRFKYAPHGGKLGYLLARALRIGLSPLVARGLGQFKRFMESGQAVIAGEEEDFSATGTG